MNARRLSLLFSSFSTTVVVLALARNASADAPDLEATLPTALNDWWEIAEEPDLSEAPLTSLPQFPEGRLAQSQPFIDFHHWELGAFVSVVDYSSSFKAHADFGGGLKTRVPVPGIPLGNWGIWAEAFVAYISRDIPFYYSKPAGTWYGAAVGGDYTFTRTEIWYLRAQAGAMYADWNNINALKNGMGVIVGADIGFYWIKHNDRATISINPQINYDTKNWVGLINFGFSYDF